MSKTIKIESNEIGEGSPVYIIAEAGVNHNGNFELAVELIDQAKETGADCVKFQTFKAQNIITKEAPKAKYQLDVTDPKETQYEMLEKLELQKEEYVKLIARCKDVGIQFLSTPYNKEDADFLMELGVSAFKIASGQLVELPFLRHVARLGKPMIISSGMATLAEVYEGVQAIREEGNNQIVLLQCTTNYPSSNKDAHIKAMKAMGESNDVLYGYSDHVPNNYASYAATALGASVIEKHFTLDTNLPGPDHSSSLDPESFKEFVTGIRLVAQSLGNKVKSPTDEERKNTKGMRRSIVLLEPLSKGEFIEEYNTGFKRPATGIAPKELPNLIGKKARIDIPADTPLQPEMIDY